VGAAGHRLREAAVTAPILSVRSLRKQFGANIAVAGVDLDVSRCERLGIIGPNGSGKTTLINCITGVLRPDGGVVTFDGTDISSWPAYRRARGGIARTFQIPRPFAGISVIQNLRVPLDYVAAKSHAADRERELLSLVGLEARAHHPAELLTQLELRKLELARALATEPRLLIVDEVMAGLSEAEINDVLDLLNGLNERGVTVLMIEHIMHAIMRFSRRLICMETGRIIADGAPAQVGSDPEVRRVYFGKQAGR
jgi:branched-chain amino acid transport system ATP-binding protein